MTERELREATAGALSAADARALQEHVVECAACHELVSAATQAEVERQLFGFDDERHLDDEQLAGYVDGTIDAADREVVETHLEQCPSCRADVEALRTPLPRRRRNRLPLAIAAGVLLVLLAGALYFLLQRPAPLPSAPVMITETTPPITTTTAAVSYGRPEWDALVRQALATGAITAPPVITELAGRPDPLRGFDKKGPSSEWPAATAVDATRPEFRWYAAAGTESIVTIARGDDEVAQSNTLHATRWTPPRDLPRGHIYSWTVDLRHADGTRSVLPPPSEPMALFRVLSAAEHEEWIEAQQSADPLLRGVVAARLGLRDEAARALAEYATQHPSSEVAARLRNSLSKWPGAPE